MGTARSSPHGAGGDEQASCIPLGGRRLATAPQSVRLGTVALSSFRASACLTLGVGVERGTGSLVKFVGYHLPRTQGGSHAQTSDSFVDSQCGRRSLRPARSRNGTSGTGRLQPANRVRPRPPGARAVAGRRPATRHAADRGGPAESRARRVAATVAAVRRDRGRGVGAVRRGGPGDRRQLAASRGIAGDAVAGGAGARPCRARPLDRGGRSACRRSVDRARSAVCAGGADAVRRRDLFWGVATLVAVEPTSLALLECAKTGDRSAAAWQAVLEPFANLEFVVSDAAKGIAAGVQAVASARSEAAAAVALAQGLDVFHTNQEARRVLAGPWRRAEAVWEEAEAADARRAEAKRQGQDARGAAQQVRRAWQEAERQLTEVDQAESAWQRARAALAVFGADGT